MARSLTASPPARLGGAVRPSAGAPPARAGAGAALSRARALRARVLGAPHRRAVLLVALLAPALLGGGWLWFRDSPLVAVRDVRIVGVHGPDAGALETALARAARRMSTLDLNVRALQAAVAPLHLVRDLRARASFPHGLRIEVAEQLPVATLGAGGARTALAADGVALGAGLVSAALPSVSGAAVPRTGRSVHASEVLAELTLLGAAPWQLIEHAERVFTGAKGITVTMRGGLTVYFGSDQRAHAKWLALARVLADASSAQASYIDVRLPSRPAAGFPAGAVPESVASASAAGQAGGGELAGESGTVAAIAAGLPGASETAEEPSAASAGAGAATGQAQAPAAQAGGDAEAQAAGQEPAAQSSASAAGAAPGETGGSP